MSHEPSLATVERSSTFGVFSFVSGVLSLLLLLGSLRMAQGGPAGELSLVLGRRASYVGMAVAILVWAVFSIPFVVAQGAVLGRKGRALGANGRHPLRRPASFFSLSASSPTSEPCCPLRPRASPREAGRPSIRLRSGRASATISPTPGSWPGDSGSSCSGGWPGRAARCRIGWRSWACSAAPRGC